MNCPSLKNVILPESLKKIRGTNAYTEAKGGFFNCTSLESIEIPASVTSIEGKAFHGCSALKNVTIRGETTMIYDSAFSGCSQDLKIYVPEKHLDKYKSRKAPAYADRIEAIPK